MDDDKRDMLEDMPLGADDGGIFVVLSSGGRHLKLWRWIGAEKLTFVTVAGCVSRRCRVEWTWRSRADDKARFMMK